MAFYLGDAAGCGSANATHLQSDKLSAAATQTHDILLCGVIMLVE